MSRAIVYTDVRKRENGKFVEPPFDETLSCCKPIAKWELAIWERGEEDYVVGYGRTTHWSHAEGCEFAMWESSVEDELDGGWWELITAYVVTIGDDIEPHMHAKIAKLN